MWFQTKDVGSKGVSAALAPAFELAAGALARAFEFSSADRRGDPPYLSVFEASLTTKQEAFEITGRRKPLVLTLGVDQVRALACPTSGERHLDVWWFAAMLIDGDGVPRRDTRPGSGGHGGIVGLDKPPRKVRKWYRVKLADVALRNGLERVDD